MGKENPDTGKRGEEPYGKIYPQPPENHEDSYSDIPDYSGHCPNCPECGWTMGYSYLKSEFKCPHCGFIMDEGDWDYQAEDEGDMPWVCKTCGGPWPQCQTSCKLFDN